MSTSYIYQGDTGREGDGGGGGVKLLPPFQKIFHKRLYMGDGTARGGHFFCKEDTAGFDSLISYQLDVAQTGQSPRLGPEKPLVRLQPSRPTYRGECSKAGDGDSKPPWVGSIPTTSAILSLLV